MWFTEKQIKLHTSKTNVWGRLTDSLLWKNWYHGLTHAEVQGEFEIGNWFHLTFQNKSPLKFAIIEMEENKSLVLRSYYAFGTIDIQFYFRSIDEEDYLYHQVKIYGFISSFAEWKFSNIFATYFEKSLHSLTKE